MTSLRFREDGSFRVLQMADVQDGPDVQKDTIRLIREAIRKADPDLVVFTGDQIRGYDPAYIDTFLRRRGEEPGARVRVVTEVEAKLRGIKRHAESQSAAQSAAQPAEPTMDELMDQTRDKVRRTFAGFLGPVIEANVPFAATYGNHDFQCGILADEQDDIYREFPGCLNPEDSLEPGTFALPIESSDGSGRVAMSVMMVNSGDYAADTDAASERENDAQYPAYVVNSRGLDLADSDGYGTPTPEALEWLGAVQDELGARNGDGKPVPAIAFQHIPPQEFYDCLKEVPAWTPNAVEGARSHAGHCYVLNHEVCRPGSRLGEAIGCADENVGEVAALTAAGGYFALFCGHDHKNAFVGHVHGIDLGYAPTCGFECYGPKSRYRGIRLFEFHESNPAGYVTRMLTWGELVGRYSSNEVRVWFEDHCITGAISARNELRRPQVFAVLAGAVSLGFVAIIKSLMKSAR
ncbi:calcineurin-like phosphoesterase [Bifidobacterium saguini DSM 23967]|uniref:Metallophosphatase n=3 Tax=Bifidobacterium TaxID=1678 RepID=A0A2N5ITV8_9BIFI|nr:MULTISPECIES: metallophosphoesterase family protein [Bifidobacterium]KFI92842.1 calcineurin-like phosphoesterase [Bifidobacterium saguini DSM 23967]PLS25378.1 metallophosphatase [Bifidobacterium imperatoris]QSY58466.1 metallophosphoesterase family protein [Bifidobacterium imperatoris]QTB91836.1 metallophosphoesterase family protein [Bifidobacterium saguini]